MVALSHIACAAACATTVAAEKVADLLKGNYLSNISIEDFSNGITKVPFDQNFPNTTTPWKISIDPDFITATKLKVALTRYHIDIDVPAWYDGPPANNISAFRDYWVNHYDWASVEEKLNKKYNHFVTTVDFGPHDNYTHPVPLHFIHHKSPKPNAIPLLFIHGTPGNVFEIGPDIEALTNPPEGKPAFHVIAPSVPGYGFSPAPLHPGMGPEKMGDAFNLMMKQLGYDKYVIQAGDYGAIILRYMGGKHTSNVVSVLCNFFLVAPNATDLERYERNETTPDENKVIKNLKNYGDHGSGYRIQMGTLPLQAVIAMTDSPLGNLAFAWDLIWRLGTDYEWNLEELITWGMFYWIPGPYSSMRHYKEMANAGIHAGVTLGNRYPYIPVPVGLMEYPKDLWYGLPMDWARRYGNATLRIVHERGGHFPSYQQPDLYMADVWQFFGNATLSNTGMWLEKQGLR